MSKYVECVSLKDLVSSILEVDERARNNDAYLVLRVLHEKGFNVTVDDMDDLDSMPSFESITRVRRKLQEQGVYPSSKGVQVNRRLAELDMRDNIVGVL